MQSKTISRVINDHFESIDSTNHWASLQVSRLKEGMLLLTTADEQTSGKGRFGHHWFSPKNLNFYGTFSFMFDSQRKDIGNLPQILALSAASTLQKLNLSCQLKWPNDLLVNKKKIGGILTEAKATEYSNCLYMLIGIGLNINMPSGLITHLERPATSLLIETGKTVDIQIVRELLLQTFLEDLNLFIRSGFSPFLNSYREQLCHLKGETVCFHTSGTLLEGMFYEISETGILRLSMSNGTLFEITSGEIF